MTHETANFYEDGGISCDDQGLTIRRYYPWGAKRILYTSIRGVQQLPLTGANAVRKWRIWGSGDFIHWWNLDMHRPKKDLALVIDIGHRVRPTITPEDPAAVERILAERIAHLACCGNAAMPAFAQVRTRFASFMVAGASWPNGVR